MAGNLWAKGGLFTDWGFEFAGALVWCLMGMLCVYTMFLIALSNIALAVLLALGPLFIGMLFFDATKRFFAAWIAQLANYALITILTVMVAALLLQVVQSFATQTAARGTGVLTVDVLHMVLIAVLVFLVLRQVMPIAAGLAGGVSLNSYGLASRGIGWSVRATGRIAEKVAAPVLGVAAPFAARHVGGAFRGTGRAMGNVYRAAAPSMDTLSRSWRKIRR